VIDKTYLLNWDEMINKSGAWCKRDVLDVLIMLCLALLFFWGLWQLTFSPESNQNELPKDVQKYAEILVGNHHDSSDLARWWPTIKSLGGQDVWFKPDPQAPWQPLKQQKILTPGAQIKTGAQSNIRLKVTDMSKNQVRLIELPPHSYFILSQGEDQEQAIPLENFDEVKKKEKALLATLQAQKSFETIRKVEVYTNSNDDQEQELWWLKSPQGRLVSDENLARHIPFAWAYLREEPFLFKVELVGYPNETQQKKLTRGFTEWSFLKSGRYMITVEGLKSKKQLQSQFDLAILQTPVWRIMGSPRSELNASKALVKTSESPPLQLTLSEQKNRASQAESLEIRLVDEQGQEWVTKSSRWLASAFDKIWQELLPQMGERFSGRVVSVQTRLWSREAQSPWSAPVLLRVPPAWRERIKHSQFSALTKEIVWDEEKKTCNPPLKLPKVWEGPEKVYAFLRIYNEHVDVRYDLRAVDNQKGICPVLPEGSYNWDYELALRPHATSEEWETVTVARAQPIVFRWKELSRDALLARLSVPSEANSSGEKAGFNNSLGLKPSSSPWVATNSVNASSEINSLAAANASVVSDRSPLVSVAGSRSEPLEAKQYGIRWIPPRTILYSSREDGWMWYELNWLTDDESLAAFEVRWSYDPSLSDEQSYRQWVQGRTYLLMLPKKQIWYARVSGVNRQGQLVAQSSVREIRAVTLKNSQYHLPSSSAQPKNWQTNEPLGLGLREPAQLSAELNQSNQ
jgi:hypothetical protein